jgi:Tfp pilus assembly protein PilN
VKGKWVLKIALILGLSVLLESCMFSPTRVNPRPPQAYGSYHALPDKKKIQKARITELKQFKQDLYNIFHSENSYSVDDNNNAIDKLLENLTD